MIQLIWFSQIGRLGRTFWLHRSTQAGQSQCCEQPKADLGTYSGTAPVALDTGVVEEAIRTLSASDETRKITGYRADFAVIRKTAADGGETWVTGLGGVNEGYGAGRYDGMPVKDYTGMIISGFASLQSTAVGK